MNNVKKAGGFSLFALWFGAAVSLAEIMTGSLVAPLGIAKGIAVILAGHVIGCLILAFSGVIGFKENKPSLLSSRISLGKYGSYMVSLFNIIQLIGWTAIMLIQCTRSIQSITGKLFGIDNFTVIAIAVGILVAIWALNADKGIHIVNNLSVVLLGILSVVMLIMVAKGGQTKQITDSISIGGALEYSIVMPLSWLPLISDYTKNAKSIKGSILGSFGGYFLGSSLMFVIGLVTAVYTGSQDPIGILADLNMGFAALIIVIFATVTTTFMDVYSGVLSTLNLAPNLSKKKWIIIYTALGTILAIFFPMEQYENFLYMIASLFAPVFSVILVDYFWYKKDRTLDSVNLLGVISAVIGTASYYVAVKYDTVMGYSIPSMVVTVIIYVLMRTLQEKLKLGEKKYADENC